MAIATNHNFGTRSIIGEKDDKGVIETISFFEMVNDTAYFLVHTVDHGGVNSHFSRLKVFLFFGKFLPRKGTIYFTSPEDF